MSTLQGRLPAHLSRRGLLGASAGIAGAVGALFTGCGPLAAEEAETGTPTATVPAEAPPAPQVVFPLESGPLAVTVEVARTDAERARGLGGHAPLGPTEGMLFVFEQPATHAFWMKGMTFPLDIMWIENGQVVHLERDLPASGPQETDATRPVYAPRTVARYVLEVNAGFAAEHGIDVGTPVQLPAPAGSA